MTTDVAALGGLDVQPYVFVDYTYGTDSSTYEFAGGVLADRYEENGVEYDSIPTNGSNWWNISSWYPSKPDADELHVDSDGFIDVDSHYRAESIATTDENGTEIRSPLDVRSPAPNDRVEDYHATSFSIGVNVVGPFSIGGSSINVTNPSVSMEAATDQHYVDWTIDTSDGNWPDNQDNSNGVNFEAYCNLTDPTMDYTPKYGNRDKDVTMKCTAQQTFGFFSTRAGGGNRLKDTPELVMYPSVDVI